MPKRTKKYMKVPWTGGLNTSIDYGVVDDNDLIQADNVIFTTSGSRLKREGFDYFDSLSAIPTVIQMSANGTDRTIIFDDTVSAINNQKLVVGERITVAGPSAYTTTLGTIASISTTHQASDTVTYTFSTAGSISALIGSTSAITVEHESSIVAMRDYWRFNTSFVKTQLFMAITDQEKLYQYDSGGRRTEVVGDPGTAEVIDITCPAASTLTAADYFLINSAEDAIRYYVWFKKDGAGVDPDPFGYDTGFSCSVIASDTAAQVATKLAQSIDAQADFIATATDAVVTVTNASAGDCTDPVDINSGVTFEITTQGRSATTGLSGDCTRASMLVFNNALIAAFDTIGDKPIIYNPDLDAKFRMLAGLPPDFSIMSIHQSRLWTNDKNFPDRLHYSSPGNPQEWQGDGDSGALDLPIGDGDTEGITAIFPSFKGRLIVAKGSKIYQVLGDSPENYQAVPMSEGIGAESHNAVVPVDLDDVLYISKRGIHTVSATDQFGDFSGAYMSDKIQTTFNNFAIDELKKAQGVYLPSLNSVAFAVASAAGASDNDALYLYNVKGKQWFRWPNISCPAITTRDIFGIAHLMIGTNKGRIITTQNSEYIDYGTTGIQYRVKTGILYPNNDPDSIKMFKKLSLLFRPKGDYALQVRYKIDNLPKQGVSFSQSMVGDKLGIDFVLGSSILGFSNEFAPFTVSIDGIGRGIQLEIINSGTDQVVEIYGFVIEYEDAGDSQEVILNQ